MKKAYKQLQEKLTMEHRGADNSKGGYSATQNIQGWLKDNGCTEHECRRITLLIHNNAMFYPYQKADAKKVLKYLKNNKYKDFKTELLEPHLKRLEDINVKKSNSN